MEKEGEKRGIHDKLFGKKKAMERKKGKALEKILEKMIEYEDTTKIVREMREKKYDLLM